MRYLLLLSVLLAGCQYDVTVLPPDVIVECDGGHLEDAAMPDATPADAMPEPVLDAGDEIDLDAGEGEWETSL